jgi:F-type H+-transporting ATPase subunit gamma
MANTKILVKRRKSVRNTRKITSTMEMVSTARLAKAQNAALAARPYARKLQELAARLAASVTDVQHPLLRSGAASGKVVLLVLTSDRGLCGGFNAGIVREAFRANRELAERGLDVERVIQGRKGVAAFRFQGLNVDRQYLGVSDKPDYQRAEALAAELIARFERQELDEVHVVYSTFRSLTSQQPRAERLLPLRLEDLSSVGGQASDPATAPPTEYIFHPDGRSILEAVLPLVVRMVLYTCMLESTAGEHAARRLAMKNATDAADEMIRLLTRQYNRARQGKITQEIAEIVGGAEAL